MSASPIWTALIRTHHITSRKKVARLRDAASNYNVYALLRSGGYPGIMYCEGSESGVRDWVGTVQRLRYKDFQLVRKAAEKQVEDDNANATVNAERRKGGRAGRTDYGKLEEVDSVKDFGARMVELRILAWWRKGMGYAHDD
ncbi:hypothetical protein K505DRAFT_233113 [Melanomma pulvis-pyrius CBS 109.77]|uniref:Uncharacterized protein n=1 Tax=Melanomma pulvis-pyrius CBS 109.77 TaxID=1314802 RepID=A0A6A6XPN5_9PLEO|nr:hypothetical protein K505DRAFT_233113 [Melanomma pulvis-pyrius CBS 109.77]